MAAVWWWGAAATVVAVAAVAAWLGAEELGGLPRPLALGIAGVLGVLALVLGWGTLRLGLGHLAGRLTLTTFGLIAGLPSLFKGGRLLVVALVLLVGVALLYLPATRAYFKEQVLARKAADKAKRQALKSGR
jgi:hypothetical protein